MKRMISTLLTGAMLATTMFSYNPVYAAPDTTNLYINGDFETGLVTPTVIKPGSANVKFDIENTNVHSGDYSLKVSGRQSNADFWGQQMSVKQDKVYIFSGYAKLVSTAKNASVPAEVWWEDGKNAIEKVYTQDQQWVGKNGWTHIIQVVKAKNDASVWPELMVWSYGVSTVPDDFYVDDVYFGEVKVDKIELATKKVSIPLEGSSETTLSAECENQFGNTLGMENLKVTWSMTPVNGVSIKNDNKLCVESDASPMKVTVTASCNVNGASISKNFEIEIYESEEAPVENLYKNGDFETGDVTPTKKGDGSNAVLSVQSDEVYDGDYALKISSRKSGADYWGQTIRAEKGKRYIYSAYAKLASESVNASIPTEVYWPKGGITSVYKQSQQWIDKGQWTHIFQIFDANADGDLYPVLVGWQYGSNNATVAENFYADNIYFAELTVSDYIAEIPTEITIPKSGKKEYSLEGEIVNQLGNGYGFEDCECVWKLKNAPNGVYVEDNKLIVDYRASVADISLLLNVNNKAVKRYKITLKTNGDSNIYIENVNLRGEVTEGGKLELEYDYRQIDGEADKSEFEWYCANTIDGDYEKIQGETSKEFSVTSGYVGKFIKAVIYPKSDKGRTADKVSSNIAASPTAPEAKNIKINGDVYVGAKLVGTYDFYDMNLDDEGESKFRWLRKGKHDAGFEAISGAEGLEYVLTDADIDAELKFEVTPYSQKEPYSKNSFTSAVITGPVRPIAKNVSISRKGNMLVGNYEYYHEYGIFQADTKFEWYINNSFYSSDASIAVPDKNCTVTFKVTPVAEKEPSTGDTYTAVMSISASSTGGSSSHGGGGGGGSFSGGTVTIPEHKNIIVSDMENHWAKEAAEECVETGIMEADKDKRFEPSKQIKRYEMVVYIMKALGAGKCEYRDEFADVNKDDTFAEYLQKSVDLGIISKDENFRPYDLISRAEFAKIISVASDIFEIKKVNEYKEFADEDNIREWAKPYVRNVFEKNIMIGNADNTFNPLGKITKAECATVVVRILSMRTENKFE